MNGRLCISIHDVAPATWPECEFLIKFLESLGVNAITLLVVPIYHRQARIEDSPQVISKIDAAVRAGAEIALHGYYHLDDATPPRKLGAWVRRRMLTANEGEFAALDADNCSTRIEQGKGILTGLGWEIHGFVPPAWLAGPGAREALGRTSLRYFSTHTSLVLLPTLARISAPCITASSRSSWRRVASQAWLRVMRTATAAAPLLRVGMHPNDAHHPQVMASWQWLLTELLQERRAVTKIQAIGEIQCAR